MTEMSNLFADLSDNNSEPDWNAYKAAGHVFIALKCTEGLTFVDPTHRGRAMSAVSRQIAVCNYHFARPDLGHSPEAEAAHFLANALPVAGGRDYLCLDLERATPDGWSHDPKWSQRFDEYVRAHSRFRTILYASASVLEQSDEWLHDEPKRLWDAAWGSGPDVNLPGYEVVFRQFTDGNFGPEPHSLPGVGVGDINRLQGSILRAVAAKQR